MNVPEILWIHTSFLILSDINSNWKNSGCNHYTVLAKGMKATDNFDELELIDLLKNKRDYLTNLLDAEIIRIEGG
jgi:hypothetical protein